MPKKVANKNKIMKKLLSLPPNLVGSFHKITGLDRNEYFCTNDPVGHKLGSGGGTTYLLEQCYQAEQQPPCPARQRRVSPSPHIPTPFPGPTT